MKKPIRKKTGSRFKLSPFGRGLGMVLATMVLLHFFQSWNIFYFTDAYYFGGGVQQILKTHQWFPVASNIPGVLIDKPPFLLWVGALFAKIGGLNTFTLRLPVLLMAVSIIALWYGFVHRETRSVFLAQWSALIAGTSFSYLSVSREFDPEIPALLFNLGIVLGAYLFYKKPDWRYLAGMLGLAFLELFTKGGFLLIALIPAITYVLLEEWRARPKNKLVPWIKKNMAAVTALAAGTLLVLGILYLGIQKQAPQLLTFLFAKGNLGDTYLKIGFKPEALFYILILAIPWSFFLSAYWLRRSEKKHQGFENFLKVWFISLVIFFLFFTTRTGATNYFLIMLFPLSYWIARHFETRLKNPKFHWSQVFDLFLFTVFGLVVLQLLISPTTGVNMIFKSLGIGLWLIGFVACMLVFSLKPREIFIKTGLGLYVATLLGILWFMPAYQKNYEFYANLIPYFKSRPQIEKVYLYGWHNELVYPSFIGFYLPHTELIRNAHIDAARQALAELPYRKNTILILTRPLEGVVLERQKTFVFHHQNCWLFQSPQR